MAEKRNPGGNRGLQNVFRQFVKTIIGYSISAYPVKRCGKRGIYACFARLTYGRGGTS